MVLTTKDKKELIEQFKLHENDTGSPEVQVGLLDTPYFLSYRSLKNS